MKFDWMMARIKNGYPLYHAPSERRIRDREFLYNLLAKRPRMAMDVKIDDIISYFRAQYEGNQFGGLSKKQRRKLYEQEGGVCFWCKKILHYSEMTVEHINPRADGGEDVWENFTIAHGFCNSNRPDPMLVRMNLPTGKIPTGVDYDIAVKMYREDVAIKEPEEKEY